MHATVLTIAGSDPTGGAGIQADLKTLTSIGVYGAAAITCITVQNSHGVVRVEYLPPELVFDQIKIVLVDHNVTHIKIGMVGTMANAQAICDALSDFEGELIYDPVMLSSTGQPLFTGSESGRGIDLLLSKCTVLTPNIPELEQLSKTKIKCHENAVSAAGQLLNEYDNLRILLIKGGHGIHNNNITDTMLYKKNGEIQKTSISHTEIKTDNSHGTGCTLASAFAAFHSLSGDDVDAFTSSVDYIQQLLQKSSLIKLIKNPTGKGGMLHYTNNIPD